MKRSSSARASFRSTRRRRADKDGSDDGDSSTEELPMVKFQAPNRIFFVGAIEQPAATRFNLLVAETVRKLRESRTSLPLQIYLTSEGGDFHAGLSMHEHVRAAREVHPIHVVADGFVASAATFVLVAGTKRLMTRTAFLLIHQVWTDSFGVMKATEAKEESSNMALMMRCMKELYVSNTSMKPEYVDKLLKREKILSYETAVKHGFVQGDASNE